MRLSQAWFPERKTTLFYTEKIGSGLKTKKNLPSDLPLVDGSRHALATPPPHRHLLLYLLIKVG